MIFGHSCLFNICAAVGAVSILVTSIIMVVCVTYSFKIYIKERLERLDGWNRFDGEGW